MIIAEQLKNKNRAEYLLYMWQVEDILRAYHCDFERLKADYLVKFRLAEDSRQRMERWYSDLCDMMRSEGKMHEGHLQINENVLEELKALHERLLHSTKFPYYQSMYYKVLPYVVELRSKGEKKERGELEVCFNMLYATMLLKLQHKPISEETQKAVDDIRVFVGQLADYYHADMAEPVQF